MKKLIALILVVCLLASVSVVLAEEISDPDEVPVPVVPPEESSGGETEDGEDPADPPADDPGVSPDPEGDSPDSESPDSGELPVEDEAGEGEPTGDIDIDAGQIVINTPQVVLAEELEVVPFASGDALAGCCFFEVDTVELGTVKIYVPVDYQQGSFTYDSDSNLVNIRSSTVTGYVLDGTGYTVRWSTFATAQYRVTTGSGYTWDDLTITDVLDTNIQIVDDDSELPLFPSDAYLAVVLILIVGVICICQFMKQ